MRHTLKIAVTLALLAYVFGRLDGAEAFAMLRKIELDKLLLASLIGLALMLMAAWRWCIVSRVLGIPLPYGYSVKITAISHLFNQVLPATIGGDAYRIWSLKKSRLGFAKALASVVLDRLAGLITLTLLTLCTAWPIVELAGKKLQLPGPAELVAAVTGVVLAGLLLAIWTKGKLNKPNTTLDLIRSQIFLILRHPKRILSVVLISIAMQLQVVGIFYFLAQGLNIEMTPQRAITVFPSIVFISTIPITAAGWGLREVTIASILGLYAVSSAAAIALGVGFGIVMLSLGIPGVACLLFESIFDQYNGRSNKSGNF